MKSIYITPLVIYGLGGGHTHTQTYKHTCPHESDFKKPGTRQKFFDICQTIKQNGWQSEICTNFGLKWP